MFDLFFSTERPIALLINLILLVLTGGALVKVFAHAKSLLAEEKALESVRTSLHQDLPESPPERRVAGRARAVGSAATCPSGTLVRDRVDDLEQMGERESVDIAGLSALNREVLREGLHFPITVGPTLVLLGLLGTLWGLATAVAELSTTLGAQDLTTEVLKTSIVGTLGGMKTAFSTTLLGIFGSILVRASVGRIQQAQSVVLREMERFLITTLVPLYETSEAAAMPEAAASLSKLVDELKERGDKLTTQLEDRFVAMEEAFNERATELLHETGKAMDAVLQMLGDRDANDPSLAEYVKTVQTVTERLASSVSVASDLIPQMEASLRTTISAHSEGLEQALTSYSSKVEPILEDQKVATAALVEAAEGSNSSVAALADQLEVLSSSFDQARASWERIDELVDGVGTACSDSISSGLHEFVSELKDQGRADDLERERLATAVGQLQGTLTSTLDRLHEERGAAQMRSLELLETVQEVMTKGLDRILDSLRTDHDKSAEGFARAIRELARELRDLHVRPEQTTGSAARAESPGFGWELPSGALPAANHGESE